MNKANHKVIEYRNSQKISMQLLFNETDLKDIDRVLAEIKQALANTTSIELVEVGKVQEVGGSWTLPDKPVVKPAGRVGPSKVKMEASMKKQRGQSMVQYGVLMASVVLSAYLTKPLIGAMVEEAFKPSIKMLERARHDQAR